MDIASVSETLSRCRGSLNLHFTCRATKVDSCGCKKDSKSFRSLRENSFPMTSINTLEPNLWVQWFVWVLLNERLYLNVHLFMLSMSWTYFHKQRSYPLPAVWQNALALLFRFIYRERLYSRPTLAAPRPDPLLDEHADTEKMTVWHMFVLTSTSQLNSKVILTSGNFTGRKHTLKELTKPGHII